MSVTNLLNRLRAQVDAERGVSAEIARRLAVAEQAEILLHRRLAALNAEVLSLRGERDAARDEARRNGTAARQYAAQVDRLRAAAAQVSEPFGSAAEIERRTRVAREGEP